jgi:hypothetical protein
MTAVPPLTTSLWPSMPNHAPPSPIQSIPFLLVLFFLLTIAKLPGRGFETVEMAEESNGGPPHLLPKADNAPPELGFSVVKVLLAVGLVDDMGGFSILAPAPSPAACSRGIACLWCGSGRLVLGVVVEIGISIAVGELELSGGELASAAVVGATGLDEVAELGVGGGEVEVAFAAVVVEEGGGFVAGEEPGAGEAEGVAGRVGAGEDRGAGF